MAYQLWDLESGNAIAEYASEAETLALVRHTMKEFERATAASWGLTRTDGDEDETVAEGDALIDRSHAVTARAE